MAGKVSYKQGTKQTYLGLAERQSNALYFCTDTRELFKGDDLYTDGLRVVASFYALPAFVEAADGKLYFCEDSGNGYVLNATRNGWIHVIHGVDNETIGLDENGLMAVKKVPIESVAGLEERLQAVEKSVLSGASIATAEKAGIVKPGTEFSVEDDGTMSLVAIAIEKVTGLEDRLKNIESAQVGGIRYKGGVATFDELPENPEQGDLYEVYEDNSEWCFNGVKWFEYGKTSNLSPVATAELNEAQFAINDGKLNIIGVDSSIVEHDGQKLDSILRELLAAVTWEEMIAV